jgi:Tol biopolymer transport system component
MRTSMVLAAAAAAAAVVASSAVSMASAASPGTNGRIAYDETFQPVGTHHVIQTLISVTPAGDDLQTITFASDPQWSPDGDRLAATRAEPVATGPDCDDVFVQRGAAQTLLTHDCTSGQPAWSPGGGRIVFVRGLQIPPQPGPAGLYIMDATGARPHLLLASSSVVADAFQPAWSLDGRHIAFTRNGSVFTIRRDGTHLRRIVRGSSPDWFPGAGQRLLYTAPAGGLRIADLQTRVVTTVPGSSGATDGAFSPNGGKVVFARDDGIWRMRLDGGVLEFVGGPVDTGAPVGGPAWQPLPRAG